MDLAFGFGIWLEKLTYFPFMMLQYASIMNKYFKTLEFHCSKVSKTFLEYQIMIKFIVPFYRFPTVIAPFYNGSLYLFSLYRMIPTLSGDGVWDDRGSS